MIVWTQGRQADRCPTCGATGRHRRTLRVSDPRGRTLQLLRCRACGAGFFAGLVPPDYAGEAGTEAIRAALAFYVQQGADVGGMASKLAALGRPAGTRYLEIGCGYGFGLDIARRALGWHVRGFDPSPFARIGRATLDLPIEPALFQARLLGAERYDVIYASELLEHVDDPGRLLNDLRQALAPDGTLLLTTPAMEAVLPTTPPGLLTPLLSAGFHVTLQSIASLARLLRAAGFDAAEVERNGAQLVARAGVLLAPVGADRSVVRRYLEAAAAAAAPGSDLALGMLGRGLREATHAGETPTADRLWDTLDQAVRHRFGRAMDGFPAQGPAGLSALAAREPLNLCGVLLARAGVPDLAEDAGRARALLHGAIHAAGRLRRALQAMGADDGDAEQVGRQAIARLALLEAQAGTPLGPAAIDGWATLAAHEEPAPVRAACFIALVHAGRFPEAGQLAQAAGWARRTFRAPGGLDGVAPEAVYCAAVMALQLPDGDRAGARRDLRRLREAIESTEPGGSAPHWLLPPVRAAEALARRTGASWWRPAARRARGLAAWLRRRLVTRG